MRWSTEIDKVPSLQRLVVISACLHLFIMLLTLVPLRTGDREFRSYHVKLISPMELNTGGRAGVSVKRHRRVIPKKRLPPAKTKQKKAIPKKTQKATPQKSEMALKRAEEAIAREIQRLRAIKEIERHRKEREGKGEEIEIIRKNVQSASAEGETTGNGTGVDANSYYGMIIEMIRNQWVWPGVGSSELEVIVSIKIDGKGNIISQEIEKSSGSTLFDQSAMRAISKANPLPPPPFGIETEIGVRFLL